MRIIFLFEILFLLIIRVPAQMRPETFSLQNEENYLLKISSGTPVSSTITDIMIIGDTVWLGSGRGLSVSFDRGENWKNFYNTEPFGDLGVSAIAYNKYDGSIWVAVAKDAEIIGGSILQKGLGFKHTTDGGSTWSSVNQPVDDPGDSTLVYGINNGIDLPKVRALPITVGINNVTYDIAFTNGIVWIASYAGGLRRSTDRGQSWQRILLPADSLDEVSPNDTIRYALQPVAGNFGPDDFLNHRLFAVISTDDSTIYAGSAGGINKTTNAGDLFPSWKKFNHTNQENPISGNWVVAFAYNANLNKLWAGTRRADDPLEVFGISSTSDGGDNWSTFLNGEGRAWNLTLKEDQIIAALDNGIFRSTDEGITWIMPNNIVDKNSGVVLSSSTFYSAAASEGNSYWDIWIGSEDGLARLRETSFWQGEWKIFLASQSLTSENETYCYPNPFSPKQEQLKIKYSTGGVEASVTIRIFNFSMDYIKTVIQNAPRIKTVESAPEFWDGTDENGSLLPNGVYFYSVEIDDNTPLFGKIIYMQ
jgi:photosystem II stability/assembly factor-like uncharacterized protein